MASSPSIDQGLRPLEIITPLGSNVLGLRSIHVQEQLSAGFSIEAELSSDDPDIKFDDIVGHPVGVRLELPGGKQRYWHGIVARFMTVGGVGQFYHYRAVVVPWLWTLTRSADCRIFQKRPFPDIVQQVFRDRGAKDFKSRLSGVYPQVEYCAQYRETDFNFVCRLLEQEGIAYYFKHSKDEGMLIMADEKAAYDSVAGYESLLYRPGDEKGAQDVITAWSIEHEVQPTEYALSDYNPLQPKESLKRMSKVSRGYGMSGCQIFDYPGEYTKPEEAERLTNIRLDELQTSAEILRAQTTCLALGAGNLVALKEYPREEQNREYLITSMVLSFDAGEFSAKGNAGPHSSCSFSAIPSAQHFRPPRTTPKPVVHGPQPALVVGPAGEEIYTDEYGRVKVSFYWDRESKLDETSSCWIRVAQGWAGKKWGGFYLPRIGHEVLVEFLEGDPDHPIITGSVYNGENKPPYALPAEKTKSTMKSLSSKGGGGFNEIRFEDKKGEEQIYIQAEKNQDIRIKNDVYEWVGHERHLVVKKDQIEYVKNNRSEVVGADHIEKIGKDRHLKITGKEAKEVGKSLSLTVKGDVIEVFKANHSEQTSGDYYLKADNIVIEATTNITIKVGQSYIAIEAGGIKIGTTGELELEATGPLSAKSQAQIEIKAPQVAATGDAMTTIKGGIVMIN